MAGLRFTQLRERVAEGNAYLGQALRMMVGVPDYDRYVAHLRATHPEREPLSYEAFLLDRQHARYGARGKVGCC